MKINNLISFFSPEGEIVIEETFETLSIKFSSAAILFKESSPDFFEYINTRDKLQILTTIGEDEPIRYDTVTNNFTNYLSEHQQRIEILEAGEVISNVIHVYKSLKEKVVSIYSATSFIKHLENLSLTNILSSLKILDFNSSELIFESQSDEIFLNTYSLQFTKIGVNRNKPISPDRDQVITKQKSAGSFNLLENYPFTPDDFNVVQIDSSNENSKKLKVLLDKLCILYSAGFVYDLVAVSKEFLDYKLNGYKVFKNQINHNDIPLENKEEYFSIYSWCYNSGNFNDKIGLSRNIISLHLEGDNGMLLKGSAFQAIQSGYKVYEKQNIKQYIEIRNKISDQILAFSEKANKIVETFASGFQKTALAFVSLFATIVISRILAAHNFDNVFTLDATIIALVFLSISLIYFFICKWEISEQQKRFKASYDNMKARNTDLLTEDDIERILNSDNEFNSDYKFISDKKKYYSLTWISFIIIFTILVLVSYFLSSSKNVITQNKESKPLVQKKEIPVRNRNDTLEIDSASRKFKYDSSKVE